MSGSPIGTPNGANTPISLPASSVGWTVVAPILPNNNAICCNTQVASWFPTKLKPADS